MVLKRSGEDFHVFSGLEEGRKLYYLSTTRQLVKPLTDEALAELVALLSTEIAPSAGQTPGIQNMSWMLSTDRTRFQSFSGWLSPDGPSVASENPTHLRNAERTTKLLGEFAVPPVTTFYELLVDQRFGNR